MLIQSLSPIISFDRYLFDLDNVNDKEKLYK